MLSNRELQVLELVRNGYSNVAVAERLNLSVMTAKNHMQNIRRKLNARTRGQAVAEARRQGLLQGSQEE
ncbi:MAG TPA: LuxR C-terminal-related transcriptional regulator [Thiobacillaceae bacterium]|nr:LuxR C-terminal-related transcriptional regulator [Thiobacillaceae bacterium]